MINRRKASQYQRGATVAQGAAAVVQNKQKQARAFASPAVSAPAQFYRIASASAVSDKLRLDSQGIRKDDKYSYAYENRRVEYDQEQEGFSGVAVEATTGKGRPYNLGGMPSLKISENDQLAIHNNDDQPREFFATNAKFVESNQKLEHTQSAVRLGKSGGDLKLTEEGEALHRLIPLKAGEDEENLPPLQKLMSSYCNKVLQELIGSSHRVAVLSLKRGIDMREEVEVPMRVPDSDPLWLRDYVSKEENNRVPSENLGEHYKDFFLEEEKTKQEAVDNYALLDQEKLDERTQDTGTNAYAKPEVGEGYMTSSVFDRKYIELSMQGIPTDSYQEVLEELNGYDEQLDIAHQNMSTEAKTLLPSWSYHFATVMATDGDDNVTLENYNRPVERENIIRDIFHELFKEFEEFRDFVKENLTEISFGKEHYESMITRANREIPEAEDLLRISLKEKLNKAAQTVEQTLRSDGEKMREMFFFHMYGPGEQSIHNTFKPFGFNPQTVRVRRSFDLIKSELYSELLPGINLAIDILNKEWDTPIGIQCIGKNYSNILLSEIAKLRFGTQKAQTLKEILAIKTSMGEMLPLLYNLEHPELLDWVNKAILHFVPFEQAPVITNFQDALKVLEQLYKMNKDDTFLFREKKMKKAYPDIILSDYSRCSVEKQNDMHTLWKVIRLVNVELKKIKH